MLYVIYGTDTDKAREKAGSLRDTLLKKRPDASLFILSSENISAERIDELSAGQGLFENKYVVFADKVLENKEHHPAFFEKLAAIAESPNIFIMLEGKLTKEITKKLEKHAEKLEEHAEEDTGPKKAHGSDMFSMADALGKRDKKSLWLGIRRPLDLGAAPEEVHGILWWQMKSMKLAELAPSAAAAGLNPFVYTKSKNYAKNFKKGEIDAHLSRLVSMYHDAHRGLVDFERELEKFALDL